MSSAAATLILDVDVLELKERQAASRAAPIVRMDAPMQVSSRIDYSPYLQFIRHQGSPGWGCFAYSTAACWDIQNRRACPDAPNLSVNRLLWFHVLKMQNMKLYTPDGRFCNGPDDYLVNFGCPTEGSELTDPDGVRWPTDEGNYEAPNFRQKSPAIPVQVAIDELRKALAMGPLRIGVWNQHFVALVGYDDVAQRFKYVDSAGDRAGENGFGYINYSNLAQEVQSADYYQFVPPKSIPTATISLKHTCRQDVYLWLSVEGCAYAKKVWPNNHRQDDSRSLTITVPLPRGFAWPPAVGNRIFLDFYDSGEHSMSGGAISVATSFCGQRYIPNRQTPAPLDVPPAPVVFRTHEAVRLAVP